MCHHQCKSLPSIDLKHDDVCYCKNEPGHKILATYTIKNVKAQISMCMHAV